MPEQKDYLTPLVNKIMSTNSNDISVMYLAKIIKISPPTADLQPLAIINGSKGNVVSKAHFLISPMEIEYEDETDSKKSKKKIKKDKIKLDYEVGDNVLVGCLDHDNMYFTNKDKFKVDATRKHSIDYAFILGRYAKKSDFKGSD